MKENDDREKIESTLAALKRRGFDARFAQNREESRNLVLELIPGGWRVGVGDSATIRSMGVLQDLVDMGNWIENPYYKPRIKGVEPQKPPVPMEGPPLVGRDVGYDVFITSSNAVTQDGKIVNIDGGGNRVAGIISGGRRAILVVGRNKIVKDVEEGLSRIKNIICPAHSIETALELGSLCVAAGRCVEPETVCPPGMRACNIVVILEGRPEMPREIVVILVNEDMGLGWDPDWPQERKDKIYAEYRKFTPPHRPIFK